MNKKEIAARIKQVYDRVKNGAIFLYSKDGWDYYYETKSMTYYMLNDAGEIMETSKTHIAE